MAKENDDLILHNRIHDGVDRRGFLKCMAWAGTGALCIMKAGILKSHSLSEPPPATAVAGSDLSFIQISDSHIGFDKAANPDVVVTLQTAVQRINAAPTQPEFLLHTGDLSHLSKPSEFDTLSQVLKGVR